MADADESITFKLGRHVSDIIGLIEQNNCQCNFIQYRLDWMYNAVVRYCDNMPSGEAVMALIQEATELLRQSEDDGFSQKVSFQAEITATGERGRPRFIISRDQLTFLLDLEFKSASAMFDLNNTQTLVIIRINYRERNRPRTAREFLLARLQPTCRT